ncbi:hypothetical protein EK21DRAFT_113275 [Setomelanomma holmii]|uniref:Nephrocystin 3-like N-terminal domain-containing protein n=1 Tax=Setomelanomma holmii TaxID=210430 RepID=A0A9P4H6F9_9PLEO|nr:hypothetical protein EK21DRAFT_113275 [Setomelanomma holmii]
MVHNPDRVIQHSGNWRKTAKRRQFEILAALESVKVKGPASKWKIIRAAIATVWKESQITAMQRRLDSYRLQLILQLQVMMSIKDSEDEGMSVGHSEVLAAISALEDRSHPLGADLTESISQLRIELRDAILKLYVELQDQKTRQTCVAPMAIDAVTDRYQLASKLIHSQDTGAYYATCLAVLETLKFEQMDFRHAKISMAHPATFKWIFSTKFKSWFQSTEPIFWISGKPGSGKSTLMKFLVDNPETTNFMQEWSGSHKVATASYFFWINGNELQRSQEGLLQALLYVILRQFPALIRPVLPGVWDSSATKLTVSSKGPTTWTRNALLNAYEKLGALDVDCKVCIFVDGLDEYEGDHDNLIDTIRTLTKIHVKMCIATRPWNVFEEAFGQDSEYKIYLQDFNQHDISLYVKDKLKKHPEFKKLQASSTAANDTTTEIVEKSNGVFLWVFLVVRSLLEGLRNRDRLSQLRARLRHFPSDLDQFFRHMFLSMDQTYRT